MLTEFWWRNLKERIHSEKKISCRYEEGKGKGKVKFRSIKGHEGPEGEYRYSYTLSLTSALDGVGGQRHVPAVYPRERPGTHCTGCWVSPRAGLDGCGKSRPHLDSIPGPSSP
jgi:hypothetical protein